MTDRDRLIELIKKGEKEFSLSNRPVLDIEEYIADYLLANGVIVPPCKVGDAIYRIVDMSHTTCKSFVSDFPEVVEPYAVIYKDIFGSYSCIPFDEFGKTVFLTEEEAEAALKERENK